MRRLGLDPAASGAAQTLHGSSGPCIELADLCVADAMRRPGPTGGTYATVNVILPARAGVYFGQLLGMADHLSFTLGRAGFRIHKILPYGPVPETLQYLVRRAQENSDFRGGCAKEVPPLGPLGVAP